MNFLSLVSFINSKASSGQGPCAATEGLAEAELCEDSPRTLSWGLPMTRSAGVSRPLGDRTPICRRVRDLLKITLGQRWTQNIFGLFPLSLKY